MKAYKGIVENGVVVLVGAELPEGTVVTVTVGETELLRAQVAKALKGKDKEKKASIKPVPALLTEPTAGGNGE